MKKIDKNYEGQIPLYKYWLQERVTWEIVTLRKPVSTEAKRCENFPCYPLVQSVFILLYRMLIKYIVYTTFGLKTSRSSEYLS